jgi:hypothetical protein
MQLGVPPAGGQTLPQVLQLLTSELVLVSQPLAGLPSQFLNPTSHTGTQAVPLHEVVPCRFEHARPHVPQLVVVLVGVSHPFRVSLSQSPKPPLHAGTQAPPVQAVVPCALLQGCPHAPQCEVDDRMSVSQPLLTIPSQLPNPAVHVGVQVPLGHVVAP